MGISGTAFEENIVGQYLDRLILIYPSIHNAVHLLKNHSYTHFKSVKENLYLYHTFNTSIVTILTPKPSAFLLLAHSPSV